MHTGFHAKHLPIDLRGKHCESSRFRKGDACRGVRKWPALSICGQLACRSRCRMPERTYPRSASVRAKRNFRIASMKNLCLIIVAITATSCTLHARNAESDVEAKVGSARNTS